MSSSYDVHHQTQNKKRVSSPDLIQLSDSDCNMSAQPLKKSGYTIMPNEVGEFDHEATGEERGCREGDLPAEVIRRRPILEEHEQLHDLKDVYTTRVRKHSTRRRLTSGSSDQGHSSPGSESSQDSTTPTNLTQDEGVTGEQQHHWHRLVNDEHCQLLGTEEDSSERHSSNEEEEEEENLLMNAQDMCMDPLPSPADSSHSLVTSSVASTVRSNTASSQPNGSCEVYDHNSSDNESIWRISEEQRSYYTQQFRKLQPDLSKVIPGHTAKTFFERSKLSTNHLTKIWNLSDITRDGALSLPEFLVAMHLVVARRNNISLPTSLPPPLLAVLLPSMQQQQSGNQKTQESHARSRGAGGSSSGGSLPPPSSAAPSLPPSEGGGGGDCDVTMSPSRVKEWTKFLDSPTSSVSSPGIKPVNFDFQRNAVEKDPLIYHPVALRVTPDPLRQGQGSPEGDSEARRHAPRTGAGGITGSSPPNLVSDSNPKYSNTQVFHRPLPRKPNSNSASYSSHPCDSSQYGPASLPMVPPPSSNGMIHHPSSCKKEVSHPPPPPPRGGRTHTRSSSLDLNKFNNRGPGGYLGAPPAVPPRASPASSSSPPRRQHTIETGGGASGGNDCKDQRTTEEGGLRTSAFAVYRKPSNEGLPEGSSIETKSEDHADSTSDTRLKDKKEVTASIKTTRDKNTRLARLNTELNQELAEVIEERIALEMQLEQMKLFTN